jgi:large subunit ribosomal protein L31
VIVVKDKIHPKWFETMVTCSCGSSFQTFSTKQNLKVEVCSSCHPYYTGKQRSLMGGKEGQVEKFRQRYGLKKEEE